MAKQHPIDEALECLADFHDLSLQDDVDTNPDYPERVRGALADWWAQNADIAEQYYELLRTVKALNELNSISDEIYSVRTFVVENRDYDEGDRQWWQNNPDASSWEHPRVKKYAELLQVLEKHLKRHNHG